MHFVETIIAYLRHAAGMGCFVTPGWQHLRRYQPGANHNRVPPARCSLPLAHYPFPSPPLLPITTTIPITTMAPLGIHFRILLKNYLINTGNYLVFEINCFKFVKTNIYEYG